MKIYTKTGDSGETSLFGGKRVTKDHVRIEAYGTIDELNSFLGVLYDNLEDENQRYLINSVQSNLFTIGSILANEGKTTDYIPDLRESAISVLEKAMDEMDENLNR
ncbi:MAG TPA: ATP:cob(I)alamin adenosyltransferase [Saprospiraceae bacterium]|nr:ATP:cob(I)alamin adenosyltransferase [Saprospiraceae bacterium]